VQISDFLLCTFQNICCAFFDDSFVPKKTIRIHDCSFHHSLSVVTYRSEAIHYRNITLTCKIFADIERSEYDSLRNLPLRTWMSPPGKPDLDQNLFDGLALTSVVVNGDSLTTQRMLLQYYLLYLGLIFTLDFQIINSPGATG
jgi:hypothetical protein